MGKPDKTWDWVDIAKWINEQDGCEELDELVYDAAQARASEINCGGAYKQMDYLVRELGAEDAVASVVETVVEFLVEKKKT
jgi:hypothetical protein